MGVASQGLRNGKMDNFVKEGTCLGLRVNRSFGNVVFFPSLKHLAIMKSLTRFAKIPATLFRAKTTNYASLRLKESPCFPPNTVCYPRVDERWIDIQSPPGFGLSLLTNCKKLHRLSGIGHIFVFKQGLSIPNNLILYKTASDHYSLEPAAPMELDGML